MNHRAIGNSNGSPGQASSFAAAAAHHPIPSVRFGEKGTPFRGKRWDWMQQNRLLFRFLTSLGLLMTIGGLVALDR